MRLRMKWLTQKLWIRKSFFRRLLVKLQVSSVSSVASPLTLRRRENNEKLQLSWTSKAHVYSLLVTFDVLWLYVVIEKSQCLCAIFCVLIHSNPKILQISLLQSLSAKTWMANMFFFRQVTKRFTESFLRDFLWFQKVFLLGNININTIVVLFSSFISYLTCCICANKIYISNRFIVICHAIIIRYGNISFEMLLKLSKNWKHVPYSPDFIFFHSHYVFEWLNIRSFRNLGNVGNVKYTL